MSFVTDGAGKVISFAEYTDVVQKDQRLLEANELRVPAESGFADTTEFVEDMLEKGTNRILLKIKASTVYRYVWLLHIQRVFDTTSSTIRKRRCRCSQDRILQW